MTKENRNWSREVNLLIGVAASLVFPASATLGQTEHILEAVEAGVGGEFDIVTQVNPPAPGQPMTASVVGESDNWPGWDSYQVGVSMEATHPLVTTALQAAAIRADTGTDISAGSRATYRALEWVVIRRTDQPAQPGERVNVRMLPEYNIDVTGEFAANGGNAGIAVFARREFAALAEGGPVVSEGLGETDPNSVQVNTGWMTMPTPWKDLPLDTPALRWIAVGTRVETFVQTWPPNITGELDASITVNTRLPSVPFEFDGPGTYTITAAAMRIVDNQYPEYDCNGDEIADSQQLAGNDCNVNGVLDDCELDTDGDGTIDACDPCAGGPASGDADGDGDTDGSDFVALEACLDGPNAGVGLGCECFDFDDSGDIDLLDFAEFQVLFVP